ncbi:hypothetical protein P6144_19615 [Sphingomonas sp. HITSZ_GF]|uniref:hypothetical protein n=1 Tax=Sphingomonas sp. HITSZ_GF TaxID=3037247 RepID=UPI00240DA599|nr:hypothetical protein [Sphingomonas sp. HITSZ_GF]MDG2535880.1 hypothetical protein [Sphingomonas sp. HITSZ_GF]
MKFAFAAAAASLLIAPAVQAQSLHETHQLVWAPAGKTPVAHWRMRDRAACPAAQAHHQAGKTALPVATKCVAARKPVQAVAAK